MKTCTTPNPRSALRSLAAVGAALAAASGAAQQTPPEEIVVTSSIIAQPRRQIGTAVSVIEFEEIELRGYDYLADVLRTQTGIGVSNSGGPGKSTAVFIRGEDSFRTLLMIDGVKALDPSAPQVSPSFDSLLTTSDLQRVEVLRGPQGFIYGADAGGVVNVITKRGADELGGQVGIEYGDYSTRKVDAALSGGNDKGDYFVSAVDLDSDGFNAQTADTVLRDDDGADNTTLHAKLGWNVSENLRLQLVARDVDAETDLDGCFAPVNFALIHDCSGTTEQRTYKVSADHSSGSFSNSFGYSNIDIARDNFAKASRRSRRRASSAASSTRAPTSLRTRWRSSTVSICRRKSSIDESGPRSRDQNGYYFEYQGAFDDALFLSLGARYDDNEDFGSHTSARVSLAYVQGLASDRSLKYRASVGTGFRAPSLFELAYNRGPFAFPPAAGFALTEETQRGLRRRHRVRRCERVAPRGDVLRPGDRGRNLLRSRRFLRLLAVGGNQHVERCRDRRQGSAR